MIKLFGAVLIFLCGAALAHLLNGKARNMLAQVEGFIELVRRLRGEIDCFSMPIPVALASFSDDLFRKCGFGGSAKSVRTVEELVCGCEMFSSELADIMSGFALHVGRGYKSEQLALCDRTLERLEAYRLSLASELPAKQKTNGTLCLCGALAVVILIV